MRSRWLWGSFSRLASGRPPLFYRCVREAVGFIRSMPLVLQIFFVFYAGPQFRILPSPWASGMIAIGLHYAAYLSEVYRGVLVSIIFLALSLPTAAGLRRLESWLRVGLGLTR